MEATSPGFLKNNITQKYITICAGVPDHRPTGADAYRHVYKFALLSGAGAPVSFAMNASQHHLTKNVWQKNGEEHAGKA